MVDARFLVYLLEVQLNDHVNSEVLDATKWRIAKRESRLGSLHGIEYGRTVLPTKIVRALSFVKFFE